MKYSNYWKNLKKWRTSASRWKVKLKRRKNSMTMRTYHQKYLKSYWESWKIKINRCLSVFWDHFYCNSSIFATVRNSTNWFLVLQVWIVLSRIFPCGKVMLKSFYPSFFTWMCLQMIWICFFYHLAELRFITSWCSSATKCWNHFLHNKTAA
jgi:hypothetical protein